MEKWTQNPDKIDNKNLTHRAVYSIVVAIFQYLLPLLIVLVIYALIYKFLQESQYPRHLRQNKTNTLLSTISLTHCIMWLPFSLFNIMADLWPDEVSIIYLFFKKDSKITTAYCLLSYSQLFQNDPELMITIYCGVHLIGLTSTCTNPVLYAFFNENLRREFEFMVDCLMPTMFYR